MFMNKQLLIIVTSLFLLSCADTLPQLKTNKIETSSQQANNKKVQYTCSRNTQLSVYFTYPNNDSDKKIAIINGFAEQAIILPSKAVATGFLFSNGKYTLRGESDKVTWTVGRMTPFQCLIGNKLPSQ